MLKKVKFKTLVILAFVVLGLVLFSRCSSSQEKSKGVLEKERLLKEQIAADYDVKLKEELLKAEIINAQNFVTSIINDTQIVSLRKCGGYTVSHDRTPKNDSLTEWFNNSEIEIKSEYTVALGVDTKDIIFNISEDGDLELFYSTHDIKILSIDISNTKVTQKYGLFGDEYSPIEVVALERIAKENIYKDTINEENIKLATKNLDEYLNNIAKSFGIDSIKIKTM